MSARLLSAAAVTEKLLPSLQKKAKTLDAHLAIIQVGNDAASTIYIKRKLALAQDIGIQATHHHLSEDTRAAEVEDLIQTLNEDSNVSGIILQLPLPKALAENQSALIESISFMKDVDGLTPYNVGRTCASSDTEYFPPATPAGVLLLLEHYDIPFAGKHVVIIGRSMLVSKPLGMMLLNRDATVTYCHSKTPDLRTHTTQADIVITAAGRVDLLTGDHIRDKAVVIDIGINSTDNGLQGDIHEESIAAKASAYTPVPGGIGPMTVFSLMRNVLNAAAWQGGNA